MGEIDSDTDDVNVSNSVDSGDDTGNNSKMIRLFTINSLITIIEIISPINTL